MKPIDLIAAALPALTDKERAELLRALQVQQHSCSKGHKYRRVAVIPAGWLSSQKVQMCCEKCGHILIVR